MTPPSRLRALFSGIIFCLLVLFVSYLSWNFIQALIEKLSG